MIGLGRPHDSDILDGWDFPVLDFSGGLNTRSSQHLLGRNTPFSLRTNQLPILQNMDRNESGALTTRFGYVRLNSAPVEPISGDGVIRSIYEYRKDNGTNHIVINAGNGIFRFDGTDFAPIGTVTTPNRRFSWTKMNDTLIGCNGVDPQVKWDGTTFAALGGSPPAGAHIVTAYREHVIFAVGTTIHYSAIGTIEDYTTSGDAGSLPVPVVKGTIITAMLPFFDRLLIFTNHEVFVLLGTDDDTFRFDVISYELGHTDAPEGVIAGGNNDVFFTSEDGVHRLSITEASSELGNLVESYASAIIEPTWKALSSSNVGNRVAVKDPANSLIIFIGMHGDMAVVADVYHRDELGNPSWALYTNYPFYSGQNVHSLSIGTRQVLLGGSDGFVYLKTGNLDVEEQIPVKFSYTTDMSRPQYVKLLRWLILFVVNVDAAASITEPLNISAVFDFGERSLLNVPDIGISGVARLGIDWVLGEDALFVPQLTTPKVSLPGVGRYLTLTFSFQSTSRLTFNGFILYGANRRLIA